MKQMDRELRQLNGQNKLALWAERVSECRNSGLSVTAWCKEHGVCTQTYYKWQKRLFIMAKEQHEVQFAEIAPIAEAPSNQQASVTVHIAGATVDIHAGADTTTVETVLRILKSC
jgi:transposase-like protein